MNVEIHVFIGYRKKKWGKVLASNNVLAFSVENGFSMTVNKKINIRYWISSLITFVSDAGLFKRGILMSGSALSANAIGKAPLQVTQQVRVLPNMWTKSRGILRFESRDPRGSWSSEFETWLGCFSVSVFPADSCSEILRYISTGKPRA